MTNAAATALQLGHVTMAGRSYTVARDFDRPPFDIAPARVSQLASTRWECACAAARRRLRLCSADDTCPKIIEANSDNERWAKDGALAEIDMQGLDIPSARTKAKRMTNGDPRLSLEERYPDHDAYVRAVGESAHDLERRRMLLEEDVERYIRAAEGSDIAR